MPILDISKSLDDFISQVYLETSPTLVYYNNYIKAAQNGGGFSVLHLIFLSIAHTNNVLAGDTRLELDVNITDVAVNLIPSLNEISVIMYNSKEEEEMFWSNFMLDDVQDFLSGYQNSMNKYNYLLNYETWERKKPYIIDHIEANIVLVLHKDGLRYRVGAWAEKENLQEALLESIKTFIFLLYNWDVLSRYRVRKFVIPILKASRVPP